MTAEVGSLFLGLCVCARLNCRGTGMSFLMHRNPFKLCTFECNRERGSCIYLIGRQGQWLKDSEFPLVSVVVNLILIYCNRPSKIVVYHFPIFHKRALRAAWLSGCSVGTRQWVLFSNQSLFAFLSRFVPMWASLMCCTYQHHWRCQDGGGVILFMWILFFFNNDFYENFSQGLR